MSRLICKLFLTIYSFFRRASYIVGFRPYLGFSKIYGGFQPKPNLSSFRAYLENPRISGGFGHSIVKLLVAAKDVPWSSVLTYSVLHGKRFPFLFLS